jgi:hypothetical protein
VAEPAGDLEALKATTAGVAEATVALAADTPVAVVAVTAGIGNPGVVS